MPYSSPEMLRGEPATAASDQFALGIVLHELLAGQHPFFKGKGGDPMVFALAISQQEPPPLTDIPAPLVAVVTRAMAKNPAARFPRPEEMADALARYLAQAGEPATSQSLSDFIAGLNPPPTLLELSESDEQGVSLDSRTQTAQRPSLATRAVEPSSFELQHEDWDQLPGGAALSMSGRLVMPTAAAPAPVVRDFRCPRCDSPLPSAHAPCDRCARELSPDLSALDEDSSPELDLPPSRNASPQARPATPPRAAAAPQAPMRSVLDMKEEELQLVERAPRPESDFDPDDYKPRRPLGPVLAKVAVLLLVVGGGVAAWPYLSRQLTSLRYSVGPTPQLGVLSIQSEPEGATVTVDGAVLGTTPLVMDNTFPAGDIPVKVTLKGYKPWTGTFVGAQPQSLQVKLRR
jgi:serine/threonine-protein kinase